MNYGQLIRHGKGSGALLMLLGAWGALIPFVGPYFGYAYTPDKTWVYSSGRFWLSILPGVAAFVGGMFVLASARTTVFGAFLAALGGAWFVIGQSVIATFAHGVSITSGSPVAEHGDVFSPATMKFLEGLGFFYGLGIVIAFFAAVALGQVVSARAAARAYRAVPSLDPASSTDVFHNAY